MQAMSVAIAIERTPEVVSKDTRALLSLGLNRTRARIQVEASIMSVTEGPASFSWLMPKNLL